jgi:hypothetical protein
MSKSVLLLLLLLIGVLLAVVPALPLLIPTFSAREGACRTSTSCRWSATCGCLRREVAGLPATRPQQGANIDRTSPAVNGYIKHLVRQQSGAKSVSTQAVLYVYAFNGCGRDERPTRPSCARIPTLRLSQERDGHRRYVVHTRLLGLTDPKGLWAAGRRSRRR